VLQLSTAVTLAGTSSSDVYIHIERVDEEWNEKKFGAMWCGVV
jgi:hypothetical protein